MSILKQTILVITLFSLFSLSNTNKVVAELAIISFVPLKFNLTFS